MGMFDPKADEAATRREVSRLSGENLLLRQAVVLLLRQSPELLPLLRQDAAVLRSRQRQVDAHPALLQAMQDTLEAVSRMAQP